MYIYHLNDFDENVLLKSEINTKTKRLKDNILRTLEKLSNPLNQGTIIFNLWFVVTFI